MEQVTLNPTRAPLNEKIAQDLAYGNLSHSQSNLLSEDLATFLVAHHILISGSESVASIKEYFSRVPEILDLVDDLLKQMEEADLVSVVGDTLKVKQRFVDIGGNTENLKKFLPRLFRMSAERALTNEESGLRKARKEGVRYFALPDDKETSAEAQAIYLEFKTKMLHLTQKADKEHRAGSSVRLVGVFNCLVVPEDFV